MSPISKAMWSQHHFAKLYGWLNSGGDEQRKGLNTLGEGFQ